MQYAALPLRFRESGELELLLITSRETRRWIIPKGWPIPGKSGPQIAAIEAYEEAGIVGYPVPRPIGSYRYDKQIGRVKQGSTAIPCEVTVFPMRSFAQLEDWPERSERRVRWFTLAQGAEHVDETELAELILSVPKLVG